MNLLKELNESVRRAKDDIGYSEGPKSDDWSFEEYMEWYTTSDLFKAIEQTNNKLIDAGKEKDLQLVRLSRALGDNKSEGVRTGIVKRLKLLKYEIPDAKKDKIKDAAE